jgi:hypothetical protein
MIDANYAAVHGWADTNAVTDANNAFGRVTYPYTKFNTSYRIKTRGVGGGFADLIYNDVVIFR